MSSKPHVFNLKEIADWAHNKRVILPSVQRGFVWKPAQIENLWDSLLRGFPVGAFVMSPTKTDAQLEILDGQQRATAICLGFGHKTFRDSQDLIRVFIDLMPADPDDPRKFIFRVITKSHPWGYQRTDNTKTLAANNIRKALELYPCEDYLKTDLVQFFPYDAILPLPFSWFIEAVETGQGLDFLLTKIQHEANAYWPEKYASWQEKTQNDHKEQLHALIETVLSATQDILDETNGQKIPALYLNLQQFYPKQVETTPATTIEDPEPEPEPDDSDEPAMVKDEIENLFVRLNAGGTPLRGEELNYSILKAHLSPAVQNEVESACQTLIRPARFIILAYRLFLVKDKPNAEAPSMSIQPKQFQRAIADAKTLQDFELFLKQLLTKCIHEEKPLLLTIKDMLSFDAKLNPHAFPYLVLRRITNDAPELMFILLYRFWVKGDQFVKDDDKHRMALGMLSLLLFFGKQDKQRDYRSLFNGIWHCVSKFDQNTFWSNATVYRAVSLDVLPTIPAYKETPKQKGLESIKSLKFTVKSNFFAKIDQNQEGKIKAFTEKMFVNRDLLLYAQRHFLSEYFQEEQFLLEDTNVPFDWDHLFPQQNIRYKKGIPKTLKSIFHSIGNLRAWPYELNREDQDSSPAHKLDPLADSRQPSQSSREKWKHTLERKKQTYNNSKELSSLLCKWSLCGQNWKSSTYNNLKENWKPPFYLILNRNLEIIEKWHSDLKIDQLIGVPVFDFASVFDRRKVQIDSFTDEDEPKKYICISSINLGPTSSINLRIEFPDAIAAFLDDDAFTFTIEDADKHSNWVKELHFSQDTLPNHFKETPKLWGDFTLLSYENQDLRALLRNMMQWLNAIPHPQSAHLAGVFAGYLTSGYRRVVTQGELNKEVDQNMEAFS